MVALCDGKGGSMVSDNRPRATFRVCPDVENTGLRQPLFQQNITEDTCEKRQGRGYHKCCKCGYHEFARVRPHLVKISMI